MLVILAYVNPPESVMFLRRFDVPFLVLLSGILAEESCSRSATPPAGDYFIKRFRRLVFPTWVFLLFFFSIKACFGTVNTFRYYIDSFLLTTYGIVYVWIILIYLYCALTVVLCTHLKPSWQFMAAVYILYEIAFYMGVGIGNRFILSTIYYLIPYGTVTWIGFNYKKKEKDRSNMESA